MITYTKCRTQFNQMVSNYIFKINMDMLLCTTLGWMSCTPNVGSALCSSCYAEFRWSFPNILCTCLFCFEEVINHVNRTQNNWGKLKWCRISVYGMERSLGRRLFPIHLTQYSDIRAFFCRPAQDLWTPNGIWLWWGGYKQVIWRRKNCFSGRFTWSTRNLVQSILKM